MTLSPLNISEGREGRAGIVGSAKAAGRQASKGAAMSSSTAGRERVSVGLDGPARIVLDNDSDEWP